MSSHVLLDHQTIAFQKLYSQHQTTRREDQQTLLEPLRCLAADVYSDFDEEKIAYEKAKERYYQEFNVFKRVFTHTASKHEKQFVLPLKQIYHQRKNLVDKIEELLSETGREAAPLEVRTCWNGSVAVVYNPITGQAEWKEYWHGGIHGVFNPLTEMIEWRQEFNTGVYGVFDPQLSRVEWKTNPYGSIHGVYNPSIGMIEWEADRYSGIGGVYNPFSGEVEWRTSFRGGVVGYYDYETRRVEWDEKWHHGMALISWDSNAKTYLTTASCGWHDDDE